MWRVLDRRLTSEEAIYQLELERIFAHGWNFVCDDSLRDPGDDLVSYIGEDKAILVHGEQGEINVPAAIAATR